LRLLILRAALLIDTVGAKGAWAGVPAIAVAVPAAAEWVLDKAIRAHGTAGFPFAMRWVRGPRVRVGDGLDEVRRGFTMRGRSRR